MGYQDMDFSSGWEGVARQVEELYGASMLFLYFSLDIMISIFDNWPDANRRQLIEGLFATKEELVRLNRLYSGKPKSTEVSFWAKHPRFHKELEQLLESQDYKYYLQKLKGRDPRSYELQAKEYEILKSPPFYPSKDGGRPPKLEYVVGAVWSRLITGKDKKVHWKNIYGLMAFLAERMRNEPNAGTSLDLNSVSESALKVHCTAFTRRYKKAIDDFIKFLEQKLDMLILRYGEDI